MPSIDFHISRSCAPKSISREISERLDMPEGVAFDPGVHKKWRRCTHNPKAAFLIGYMIGQKSKTPRKGVISAMQHILDDMQMSLFKTVLRGGEEEEEDKEEEEV